MIKELIETFRRPSSTELAQRELDEAQRELLRSQSASEYAQRMTDYHRGRISRLTAHLKPKEQS